MRVSYVINLNVVEKSWTPTQRQGYTTVKCNPAEKLTQKTCCPFHLQYTSPSAATEIHLVSRAKWLVDINVKTVRKGVIQFKKTLLLWEMGLIKRQGRQPTKERTGSSIKMSCTSSHLSCAVQLYTGEIFSSLFFFFTCLLLRFLHYSIIINVSSSVQCYSKTKNKAFFSGNSN